jgi:hypothetical protein
MSIKALTWVFEHSEETLGRRLVLLALADYAHDDGSEAYPAVSSLAAKARMSERQVQRALRGMERDGTIVRDGKGPHQTTKWTIRMEGGDNLSGVTNRAGFRPEMSPDPSLDPLGVEEDSLRSSSSTSAREEKTSKLKQANGVVALCERLAELMRKRDPKAKVAPNSISWLTAAEALMRIDERHFEEAIEVLEFSQADPFWQTHVLSMPTFRVKYPALRAKWVNSKIRSAAAAQPQASVADLVSAYERPRSRTGVA